MKVFRKVILLSILAAILCGAWLLTPVPKPLGKAPSITFSGFTNEQGIDKALFSVSNATPRAIYYLPFEPQFRSTGEEWHTARFNNRWPFRWPVLEPGSATIFSVLQTNSGIWRVPLWWDYLPGVRDQAQKAWKENWQAIGEKSPLPGWRVGWGHIGWTNYSDSITNSILFQLR